jgi:hypothetical protein
MTDTEMCEGVETLVSNWADMAPLVAEVQRRTGLTRTQVMLLWLVSMDDDEPEPWRG